MDNFDTEFDKYLETRKLQHEKTMQQIQEDREQIKKIVELINSHIKSDKFRINQLSSVCWGASDYMPIAGVHLSVIDDIIRKQYPKSWINVWAKDGEKLGAKIVYYYLSANLSVGDK